MSRTNDLIRQLLQSTSGANNLRQEEITLLEAFDLLNPFAFGWVDYNHDAGAVSFAPDVWQDVPNNGAGAFTNTGFAPLATLPLIDTATGAFDLKRLEIGSMVLCRHDITVTVSNNNTEVDLRMLFSAGQPGEFTVTASPPTQLKNAGTFQIGGFEAFYVGNEEVRDHPAKLQIKADNAGSFVNSGTFMIVAAR